MSIVSWSVYFIIGLQDCGTPLKSTVSARPKPNYQNMITSHNQLKDIAISSWDMAYWYRKETNLWRNKKNNSLWRGNCSLLDKATRRNLLHVPFFMSDSNTRKRGTNLGLLFHFSEINGKKSLPLFFPYQSGGELWRACMNHSISRRVTYIKLGIVGFAPWFV